MKSVPRFHGSRLFILAAAVFMISLAVPAFSVITGATLFKFSPPDGVTWVETIKENRVETVDGESFATNNFITKVQYTVRKLGDGYVVTRRPISFKAINPEGRDEQELEAIIEEMTQTTVCQFDLDMTGNIVDAHGFGPGFVERLTEAVHKKLPLVTGDPGDDFWQLPLQNLGTRWDVRYALFTGLKAKVGETWKGGIGLAFFPTFTQQFAITMKYAENVNIDGKQYARLVFKTPKDPATELYLAEDLAYYDGTTARFIENKKIDESDHSASDLSYTFKGEWLVDPSTLLYKKTKEISEIKWVDSVSGEGLFNHELKSTVETTFDYAGEKKSAPAVKSVEKKANAVAKAKAVKKTHKSSKKK